MFSGLSWVFCVIGMTTMSRSFNCILILSLFPRFVGDVREIGLAIEGENGAPKFYPSSLSVNLKSPSC